MPGHVQSLGEAVLTWCVVGALAGYVMGFFRKRVNTGWKVLGDVVAGVVGACAGGFAAWYFVVGRDGLPVSAVAAAVGACVGAWAWRAATEPGQTVG